MGDGFAADGRTVGDVYTVVRVVAMYEEVACDAAVVVSCVGSATSQQVHAAADHSICLDRNGVIAVAADIE